MTDAAEDVIERLDAILVEEDRMHPIGCATWEEETRVAVDMAKDFIRRSVTPNTAPCEAVARLTRIARGERADRVYGAGRVPSTLHAEDVRAVLARPTLPEGWADVSRLQALSAWLDGLSRHEDLNDVVADGGITSGMVYQQEARDWSVRVAVMLSALPLPFGGGDFSPSDQRDRIPGERITATVDEREAGE